MSTSGTSRTHSLRGTLMAWLVPTFLAVALVSAGVSYRMVTRMAADFLDDQMVQLGDALARQGNPGQAPAPTTQGVTQRGLYVIQFFAADGQLLTNSWDGVVARRMSHPGLQDLEDGGQTWRVYAAETDDGHVVQVLQSGAFRATLAYGRAGEAALPVLLLLPLSMLVLWGVVRAISARLRAIGQQAAQQDAQSIAELPLDRVPEEIRPLVTSFNHLLTRLRESFAAQRLFVQDAAHELRTPIAAVGLQLENLREDLGAGEASPHFQQLEAGVGRAKRLVDQLLKMSRQEAIATESPNGTDVRGQVHDSIRTLIPLADRRRIDLGLVAPDSTAPIPLRCSAADLRSALDNLIENALHYTPEGGVVDVRIAPEPGGGVVVEVVDTGPGIATELLDRVFDRFYRVPGSAPGGSGLGLAIAQAAAHRCGMQLTLRNRDDRSGLVARLASPPGRR